MISTFPEELLLQVFENCSQGCLLQLRVVSKDVNRLCTPLAFRNLRLYAKTLPDKRLAWDQTCDRLRNVDLEGFGTHVRDLSLKSSILDGCFELQDMKLLFEHCHSFQINRLTCLNINAAERNVDQLLNKSLLWMLGNIFRGMPPTNLKSLNLTICDLAAISSFYNLDPRAWTPFVYHGTRLYFPRLETLRISVPFTLSGLINPKNASSVRPALSSLTAGLAYLKDFQVHIESGSSFPSMGIETREIFHGPILEMSNDFDPTRLVSFDFGAHFLLRDTSGIIETLAPMRNVEKLRLRYLTLDPTLRVEQSGEDSASDWADVFKLCGELPRLVVYSFSKCRNIGVPLHPIINMTDIGATEGGGQAIWYKDEQFSTRFQHEWEAWEHLRDIVDQRRKTTGDIEREVQN